MGQRLLVTFVSCNGSISLTAIYQTTDTRLDPQDESEGSTGDNLADSEDLRVFASLEQPLVIALTDRDHRFVDTDASCAFNVTSVCPQESILGQWQCKRRKRLLHLRAICQESMCPDTT